MNELLLEAFLKGGNGSEKSLRRLAEAIKELVEIRAELKAMKGEVKNALAYKQYKAWYPVMLDMKWLLKTITEGKTPYPPCSREQAIEILGLWLDITDALRDRLFASCFHDRPDNSEKEWDGSRLWGLGLEIDVFRRVRQRQKYRRQHQEQTHAAEDEQQDIL